MVSFAHKKPRKLAVGIIINPAMATCPWQPRLRIAMATKNLRSIATNLINRPHYTSNGPPTKGPFQGCQSRKALGNALAAQMSHLWTIRSHENIAPTKKWSEGKLFSSARRIEGVTSIFFSDQYFPSKFYIREQW